MPLFNMFEKKPKIVDDLFGELAYTTFRDSHKNFYSGTTEFNSQQIGIILDADETGPMAKQKEFYISLQDSFLSLKTEVLIPFIKKELADWIEENPIIDFDAEFKIDGIYLYRMEESPIKWSLTLYSLKMHDYLTIEFNDMTPEEGITVDG